jgi:hypothetical protein
MIVYIWTRNDGTGILDDEFRDGDIMMCKPDSWEESVGISERAEYLVVKMPDPPSLQAVMTGLVQEEWEPDGSGMSRIKRQRKFAINWRAKFTETERAIIADPFATLGVVADRFTHADIIRKN